MTEFIKKIFRSVQVHFPFLQDLRFNFQMGLNRMLGKPHEDDFKLLRKFPDNKPLLFADIGANRGEAVQSMLSMKSNCSIVAFEPNPIVYQKLVTRNSNNKNVVCHNYGLGKETGSFTLFLPFFRKFMFDGLASFNKAEAENWLKGRIFGYKDKNLHIREIVCKVERFDDLGLIPYFIKIDVQGLEYEVLVGAGETLKNHKPILLIETPPPHVVEYLTGLNYRPYHYSADKLQEGFGPLNTYFFGDGKINELND